MAAANIVTYTPQPVPAPGILRGSALADPERVRMNMKAAEYFAASDLVPAHYRGKPANCFIAINRAQRLGCDEFYFLEKTSVIGGKLVIAAELAIELANSSGRFRGPIRFTLFGEGEGRGCTASAVLAATGETVENTVTYAMAKADGWTRNSKWQSIPDQMLQYRAGVFLTRLYAGGALAGLPMHEEVEDVIASRRLPEDALAAPVSPEPKAIPAPAAAMAPKKAPLLVNLPDGWPPAQFPRTRKGLTELLEFITGAVLDGSPQVVGMNCELLDLVAEKLPELADEISELRASAAEAMAPKDEPEPDDDLDEFGLPPVNRDTEVLPTDPP